jgi:hypothetical protein
MLLWLVGLVGIIVGHLIGIPAHLLFRRLGWHGLTIYVAAAAIVAVVLSEICLDTGFSPAVRLIFGLSAGLPAGWAFRAVALSRPYGPSTSVSDRDDKINTDPA